MNNSSGGFGDADSVNSFGDHRPQSEGEHSQHGISTVTQHTTPTPEVREENKDLANSSSDTANFFQNSPPGAEHPADLSFDNDSVMGTNSNPIRLGSVVDVRRESFDHDRWENNEESSYSGYTTSMRDDLTSQTRSTRTQDHLAPLPRPRSQFSLNTISLSAAMEGRGQGGESSNALLRYQLPGPVSSVNTDENRSADNRPRPLFEEQVEEVLDEMAYLVNTERINLRDTKTSLADQSRSFSDYYRTESEKLADEKETWTRNMSRAKAMFVPPEEIFQINIGGTHVLAVTKSILCRASGSALAAMFSGRHKLKQYKGKVFIDRDGEAFRLMVSYLRNGKIPPMADKAQESLLYDELEYWQIPLDLTKPATEEMAEFDPMWCAGTLRLENCNTLVRKHGKFLLCV